MLKLAEKGDLKRLKSYCFKNVFGAYIICRAEAYGFSSSFSKIWIGENENGKINCAVSSLDGNAVVLASEDCDFEELSFMIFAFGFSSVMTDAETARKCGIKDFEIKPVLRFESSLNFTETVTFDTEEDMKGVYELFSFCFPERYGKSKNEYLSWLSDFTFRKNRNLARLEVLHVGSKVVSAAATAAQCEDAAVISSVACAEEYRGKGFGVAVTLSLVLKLKSENADVFVVAENGNLSRFYEKIGFKECGFAAYIERH